MGRKPATPADIALAARITRRLWRSYRAAGLDPDAVREVLKANINREYRRGDDQ